MSIEERLQALAEHRAGRTAGFCAARMTEWEARVKLYLRFIRIEYYETPEEYREQWLNEQEAA